ncbi:hypothetical protein SSX86_030438 [Deinandra increscens subsp. villosa]|uniref:Protein kinase domain-containing protein n=1 Tax=Deinandra increscens subsp. villosa TaxID=3103831 RepID=A0AAP0GJ83_9ASTR
MSSSAADAGEELLLFQAAADTDIPLEWGKRTEIMIGVARGLQYLHSEDIIHYNLRSRNVLVTEYYNAKLGGLSLAAKLCCEGTTRHCQPMAYEDPEYKRTGKYCYGLQVLECLTGRHSFSFSDDKIQILVGQVEAGTITVKDIMDPRLEARYASEWFALALRCLADNPDDRPSIGDILPNLKGIT